MNFTEPTAIPAQTLGTDLSPVIGQDCMIDSLDLVNNDSSSRTVTIKDGNGKVYEPAIEVPAGSRIEVLTSTPGTSAVASGKFFARGLHMSASVGAMVDVWPSARLVAR